MLSSIFEELINNNKILLKYENLLKTLSDDRVMMVCHSDESGYYIEECCDEWYYHDLTKEECIELSEMFREIAESLEQ